MSNEQEVVNNNFDKEVTSSSGDRPFVKKGGYNRFYKKKVCRFCSAKTSPSYKESEVLKKFITEKGKILPARITGTCAKHQRFLATEIKRARFLAFMPFKKD